MERGKTMDGTTNHTRDYRDDVIEEQANYIANLEADLVTTMDLSRRLLTALHEAVTERDILRGQRRIDTIRQREQERIAA
jgi:hypothetical protein